MSKNTKINTKATVKENSNDLNNETETMEKNQESINNCNFGNALIGNSLKLMNGKFGGGFYVNYVQDNASKYGWIRLIIEYPDKTLKAVTLYKNVFKESTFESNGIHENKNESESTPKYNSKAIPRLGNYRHEDLTILDKYASPQMPIPGEKLWKLIQDYYEQIPVVIINNRVSIEELYMLMEERAKDNATVPGYEFMNASDRFFISTEDFKKIIQENGHNVTDVRAEIDIRGLFIKDKNTVGYQYSKRIDTNLVRFYVLKKHIKQPETSQITRLDDLDFKTDRKSKLEKEIESLGERNKKLYDIATRAVNGEKIEARELI